MTGRVYHFRDRHLSQTTFNLNASTPESGAITEFGEFHNDLDVAPPIRVSADGSRVLLGTGDVYDAQSSLLWADNVFGASGVWPFADGHGWPTAAS